MAFRIVPLMSRFITVGNPFVTNPDVTWVATPVPVDSLGNPSLAGKLPDTVTSDLTQARKVVVYPDGTVKVDH